MKVYNPKDWLTFLITPQNSKLFKRMNGMLALICLISALIVYIEQDYLKLGENHALKNTGALQSLLGFAISILLVFRTNTAYDRWWEGRKLWGSLVNNSRNLAIKVNSLFGHDSEAKEFYRTAIPLYAHSLKNHLMMEKTRLMLDEISHPEFEIDESKHIPNQVANTIFQKSIFFFEKHKMNDTQFLFINNELSSFTDVCGACERIKNTPIPYSYSAFIKKVVFFYIITLPVGLTFTLGYWSIPVVALVFYVMVGLELVAEEIEDPFGGDENDIPMNRISENIEKHVKEILS